MIIELHPDAVKNINRKADVLRTLPKLIPKQISVSEPVKSNFYVGATITEKDIIGEFEVSYVDGQGKEIGKVFEYESNQFGLIGNDYNEFIKLVTSIQEIKEVEKLLSVEFIKKNLFSWIKEYFSGQAKNEYVSYLLEHSKNEITEYEIWIPIPLTAIQNEFTLGKIFFKQITELRIDEWFSLSQNKNISENREGKNKFKLDFKKKYQGYAAGVCIVSAEAERAQEIAFGEVNKALGILRLLSPAIHYPELICGANEVGRNMIESKNYLTINVSKNIFLETNQILDKGIFWNINGLDIASLKKGQLSKCNILIENEFPNEYQKNLLDALMIYSKSTLRRDYFDRILYILTSLETVLLRNSTEPIQQNIGDRMAFLIGRKPDDRKLIVDNIKKIYAIRSKFIHHGYSRIEDVVLIRGLMEYAYKTFVTLVNNADNFKTKEELFNALDKIKYS